MSSSDSIIASTVPIINTNEDISHALAEAVNDNVSDKQAPCGIASEACDKAPEACCKQVVEEKAEESGKETNSDEDSCVKSAELCTKEPEACCMKTVEEVKDVSGSTKTADEAVTAAPAVDGAAEVEVQAGNKATASSAAEEKAVEAVGGEEVVAATQKIEDLAISGEEDMPLKKVLSSDEFADSDINLPFKFEAAKQLTETTGGTPVEVEKTEKVAENGGCCSSCH